MKSARNHEPMLLALRAALEAARLADHTVDEFAKNVVANLSNDERQVDCSKHAPTVQVSSKEEMELVIPRPQPNELLHGWRGRLRITNGFKTVDNAEAALWAWVQKEFRVVGENPGFAKCAAFALGVTEQEVIEQHTLMPYFTTLQNVKPNKLGLPGRHQRTAQRRAPLRLDVKEALFCAECAKEDLDFWGFSYWRRSHHLAGVACCSTHARPLLVAGDRSCFEYCPDHYLSEAKEETLQYQDGPVQGILLRYARIAEEILDSAPQIDSVAASALIRERVKEAGLSTIKGGKRKTLSTHIMDLLPLAWLQQTFPRIHWAPNKYISTVDGVCMPLVTRYTASMLSLLAAVLYDDADRALVELIGGVKKSLEPSLGFDFWASREVFELYCAHEGVVQRMADAVGLPSGTMYVGLLNQGLPGFGNKPLSMKPALRAFYAGESIEVACQIAGVSQEVFIDLVRSAGARLAKALDRMSDADQGNRSGEDTASGQDSSQPQSFR